MNLHVTTTIAVRVLRALRRDPRTVALMLFVPCLLIGLFKWVFSDAPGATFEHLAPSFLALFPFTIMFLVTSITTLRERTSGTLERLFTLPMSRVDFILGYLLAFGVIAVIGATMALAWSVWVCGLSVSGSIGMLLLIAIIDAVLGTALGLCVSAMAHTEFQAVQFMPAVVFPQLLLCGMFLPRSQLPDVLHAVSNVLPLSYAVDAMTTISHGSTTSTALRDMGIVALFIVGCVGLGALTLRRRTD